MSQEKSKWNIIFRLFVKKNSLEISPIIFVLRKIEFVKCLRKTKQPCSYIYFPWVPLVKFNKIVLLGAKYSQNQRKHEKSEELRIGSIREALLWVKLSPDCAFLPLFSRFNDSKMVLWGIKWPQRILINTNICYIMNSWLSQNDVLMK